VSGFSFDPSLTTARDRVVGIMLGLLVMWLAYHSVGTTSAAEHMVLSFSSTLRDIAELALQPGSEVPDKAMKRIRALRNQIGYGLQQVRSHSDAVPFEFGIRQRAQGMAHRALIRSWLPQLQTIYLIEVALMQHRVFGAGEHLPLAIPAAQRRFNEACSALLVQMADFIDGKLAEITPELDAPLRNLTLALEESSSDHAGLHTARGIEEMSRRIAAQLTELSRDICRSSLARPEAAPKLAQAGA
jgi:multidrug resistance protein MdtO